MVKRKTINIKSVKLVRPKYVKPIPLKVISLFTEPQHIAPEGIKEKKKRSNLPSQKVKKANKSKPVRKGPLILTKKSIQKLAPKVKPKKKRKSKVKKQQKTTFIDAFPSVPGNFSDDVVDWGPVRETLVKQFEDAIYSIIGGSGDDVKKPARLGARYAIDEFMRIPGIENDDLLADFLIQHPVHELFNYDALYSAGVYFLSNGRKNTTFQVDKGIESYSNMISGVLLDELADGDFTEEEY